MKKIKLDDRLYNVSNLAQYNDNPELYNARYTAAEFHGNVYPIRNVGDTKPGVYIKSNNQLVYRVQKPETEEEIKEYSSENIIDFSKASSIDDMIKYNNIVRDIEKEILATKENILCLPIDEQNDTPEMKIIKQAINLKQVDKKQYEDKFPQYQNDMRLLKGNSITFSKFISISEKFDIDVVIQLKDKDGDIVNPMNTVISASLTEGRP